MKNRFVLPLIFTTFLTSCTLNPLRGVDTYGLTYDGTNVYYFGELCAELSAIEVAYDDGRIVREATFVLVDSKYNDQAISVIKLVKEKQPSLEVEVELKK